MYRSTSSSFISFGRGGCPLPFLSSEAPRLPDLRRPLFCAAVLSLFIFSAAASLCSPLCTFRSSKLCVCWVAFFTGVLLHNCETLGGGSGDAAEEEENEVKKRRKKSASIGQNEKANDGQATFAAERRGSYILH